VRHNAILKGEWVWERTAADLVIAADTIVVKDGQIFEKPKNRDEAFETLRLLSKATHQVITAIFLRSAVEEIIDHELT
ncbi:MAG: septum formation protein Maf, partial [Phycisphaerae bacterium]|nr:septum formation protein Maf [Phycisphaerae bacterium]NIU08246.1 septum formation protein Maf [Phycisphaerae bacterium]NIX26428.1 septum formation protein Maf [Phycisphaerae bacterium]